MLPVEFEALERELMILEDVNALHYEVKKLPPTPKIAERRWNGGPDIKIEVSPTKSPKEESEKDDEPFISICHGQNTFGYLNATHSTVSFDAPEPKMRYDIDQDEWIPLKKEPNKKVNAFQKMVKKLRIPLNVMISEKKEDLPYVDPIKILREKDLAERAKKMEIRRKRLER